MRFSKLPFVSCRVPSLKFLQLISRLVALSLLSSVELLTCEVPDLDLLK